MGIATHNTQRTYLFIGLANSKKQNLKIIHNCGKFAAKYQSEIVLVSKFEPDPELQTITCLNIKQKNIVIRDMDKNSLHNKIVAFLRIISKNHDKQNAKFLHLIRTDKPEAILISAAFLSQSELEFNVASIRGAISSSKFLRYLKYYIKDLYPGKKSLESFVRIALLREYRGHDFLFAPVGIDEASSVSEKEVFIDNAIWMLNILQVKPQVALLSGGRISDLGRDEHVDMTIKQASELERIYREKHQGTHVYDCQILIERAIEGEAKMIVAPDGISGNLIYRTLVHLGGGQAFGALYSKIYFDFSVVLIDCSRNGNETEIYGSLMLAKYFSENKKEEIENL